MQTIKIGNIKIKYGIDDRLGDDEFVLISVPEAEYNNYLRGHRIELDTRVCDDGNLLIVARMVPIDRPQSSED